MLRKPIQYNFADGQMLYAVLQGGEVVHVGIELPDGAAYASWSVSVPGIVLDANEFVAQTWGDTHGLMASAMLGTGWFLRTGRRVALPAGEENEVWRLSDLGCEWMDAVANQQDRPAKAVVSDSGDCVFTTGAELLDYLVQNHRVEIDQWSLSIDEHGVWLTNPYGVDCGLVDASVEGCDSAIAQIAGDTHIREWV